MKQITNSQKPINKAWAARNLRLTNFELLSEQELRTLGRTVYQLSNEQVLTPNYGAHTLRLLDYLPFDFSPKNIQFTAKLLMDIDEGGTMEKSFNQERFKLVSGLNKFQTLGITDYGLTLEQVLTDNYGEHTLRAMDTLPFQPEIESNQEAFQLVSGLDASQTRGITDYGLSRTQVLTRNFGNHTLRAIYKIVRDGRETNNQDAFSIVSGLNRIQTRGIVEYGLKRLQVASLEFSESILKVMGVLRKENPDAAGPYLYDTATKLQPYQIHGIAQENRTLGELNIALDDNGRFGQYTPLDTRFKGNFYRPGGEGVFSRDFQEANRQILMMLTRTPVALPFIPVLDAGNQFIGQNSPEQYLETGGDLERGYQEGQESATMPNEIPEPAARAVDSFLALAQSPVALIPPNVARRGDPDLNNTKPNKNHKLKTKQNKP